MYITVHLRADIVPDLRRHSPRHRATNELIKTLAQMGLRLQPLHVGVDDQELARQFFIDAPDTESADDIVERLTQSDAVDAVYSKPPAEPPST
jgi:hypothetical protein